jgi:hypothetical protein
MRMGINPGADERFDVSRSELSQFPGDVKGGTLGDHVTPSVEADLQ